MADTHEATVKALEKRLKKQPRTPLFAQLASYYFADGRADDALRLCNEGLAYHPFYTTGHLVQGKILMTLNKPAEARDHFQIVHDLLPSIETVERLLSEANAAAPPPVEEPPATPAVVAEEPVAEPPPVVTTVEEIQPPAIIEPPIEAPVAPEASTSTPEPSPVSEPTPSAAVEEPVAAMEDAFGAGTPTVEEPSPIGAVETPAEPAMAAPTAEDTFEDFSARMRQELAGTENTITLENYLSGNAAAPEGNPIEDLAQKLQGAKITPVIDLSAKSSEGGSGGASSGIVTPTLAEIYVKQGWFDDAIRAYKTLATNKPDEKEAFELRIAEIEEMKKQQK